MEKKKVLIIGSGPCGLGAAYRLQELGVNDFLIIEKENYCGGLATSFVDKKGLVSNVWRGFNAISYI